MFTPIESLERRQMLSLATFTPDRVISDHGFSSDPAIATAGNGAFVIARVVNESPSTINDVSLVVTRYSPTGSQIGKTLALISGQETIASPAVSTDAGGNSVFVYGTSQGLFYQRVSKDGSASAPVATGIAARNEPAISMDAGGGFFVGAIDVGNLYLRAFDASGKARAKAFTIATRRKIGFTSDGRLKIAVKADGSGALVAYNDGNFHANVIAVSPSGYLKTVKTIAEAMTGFDVSATGEPLVAHDHYVADYDPNSDGPDFSYYERFVSDVRIAPDVSERLDVPNTLVNALPDGGFFAAFLKDGDVYAVRHRADGLEDSAAVLLYNGIPFGTSDLAIAADKNGTVIVSWVGGNALHYRRLTTNLAAIDGSELYVLGEEKSELLSVRKSGDKIIATRSKTDQSFDASLIQSLTMNAFGGDDQIVNSTGLRASIQGGDGNDTITSAASVSIQIEGGNGDDRIVVADNAAASVYGGNGNDSLVGGAGNQYFAGQAGNDTIAGGAGNDRIIGGDGNDRLMGETGNDTLDGGAGNDYIDAGKDNDVIVANDNAADTLFGGAGNDSAQVDKNVDLLDGIESTA